MIAFGIMHYENIKKTTTKQFMEEKKFSRLNRWKPTNVEEMKKFIRIHMLMGFLRLPDIKGN